MNQYNNRGLLFKNLRKRQPKHPDLTGEATISGRKFKLAAWLKPGRRAEFYSIAFTEESTADPTPEQADTSESNADNPQDYAF
jgi:hypothetical protein